jgi:quinoprotein glucose dehydrogenase
MENLVARHRAPLASIARGGTGPRDSTWPSYGNDPGGGRYSPLAQIDRSNVTQLRVAWTHRTGALQPETPLNKKAAFEATPILVEGKLFLSTPFNQVIALDPGTGAKLWEHDVKLDRSRNYSEVTSRGVSAWRDPMSAPGTRAACASSWAPSTRASSPWTGRTGRRAEASVSMGRSISRAASTCAIWGSTR